MNPPIETPTRVKRIVRRAMDAVTLSETVPPRVAFFIPALRVGGAQRVTVNIANGLAARGYPVDLVLAYREGPVLSDVSDDVRVIDLETPEVPLIGVLASVPRLRSYFRSNRPAVCFSAMTFANVAAILAAELSDVETTLVATEHDTFGMVPGRKEWVTSQLARHLYRFADRVAAVSEGVADSVRRETSVDDDDVAVLYNPIELDEIRTTAADPVAEESVRPWLESDRFETLFTVGRIESQKDIPTLLRAFRRVREQRPNARLVVAGTGSRRDRLVSMAEDLGLGDVVAFPGYVENAYAYMSRADLFVLSSRHEGLPTVLLEALACGCPIVSTDCPSGPREILEGGRYGPLVPVEDPAALAEAILGALDDPVDREALLRRSEDFSMEAAVDGYAAFIDRVTAPSDAAGPAGAAD